MSIRNTKGPENSDQPHSSEDQARRDFLKKAGRFAVVTPPAITLLLGTSLNSRAIAAQVVKAVQAVKAVHVPAGDSENSNHFHIWPARPKIGRLYRRLFVAPTPALFGGLVGNRPAIAGLRSTSPRPPGSRVAGLTCPNKPVDLHGGATWELHGGEEAECPCEFFEKRDRLIKRRREALAFALWRGL